MVNIEKGSFEWKSIKKYLDKMYSHRSNFEIERIEYYDNDNMYMYFVSYTSFPLQVSINLNSIPELNRKKKLERLYEMVDNN